MRTLHVCQSITGPLMRNTKRDWQKMMKYMKKGDGTPFRDADEIKAAFIDEALQGHEVIPIGDCDNFDYKKGCLGHVVAGPGECTECGMPCDTSDVHAGIVCRNPECKRAKEA